MDVTTLPARKLHDMIDKRRDASSVATKAMIQAGRSMETFRETRAKAEANPADTLAIRCCATFDAYHEAAAELDARRRYHGGDKPIKRRVW